MRKVKSWTGAVQRMHDDPIVSEDLPLDRRRLRRAMSSAANLPPLAALPPPISMGIPPPANIDMDVDFEAEIKPHMTRCLVRIREPLCSAKSFPDAATCCSTSAQLPGVCLSDA